MKQLFLNGKLMDLSEKTRIGITYQANSVGELQGRQGTFTNKFKLPYTQRNCENLEFSHIMTTSSNIPYRHLVARYVEDGIETIPEGLGILEPCDQDFFIVSVTSGNIDLSNAIGDLIVGDLYEDDTVYNWNLASAFNFRDGSDYFIYPIIDWRSDIDTFFSANANVDIRQMLVCATMPEMFSRLESYLGFTFTGPYLQSDAHQKMILTPDNFTINPAYLAQEETKGSLIYGAAAAHTDGYLIDYFPVGEDVGVVYERVFPIQNTFESGFTNNLYTPTVNHIGTLKFNSLLNCRWSRAENYGLLETHQTRSFYIVTRIIKQSTGSVLAEITSEVFSGKITTDWIQFSIGVQTNQILLEAGQTYYCAHDFVVTSHTNISSAMHIRAFSSVFTHTPTDILTAGSPIRFRDIFRMKVKDVLFDILRLRGIIIQTNNYTKEVQFNEFQDVVDNIPNAVDWSSKLDVRATQLGFKFGSYAQKNWLRFKANDNVDEFLGDSFFEIDDTTLEAEKTVVQMNHSATMQENRYFGYNVPSIDAINAQTKWQKPGYRILELAIQNTDFNVNYSDGLGGSESTMTNVPFAKFIGFDELVPDFYGALTGILDQTKVLKLFFNLTPIDISTVDFAIPIQLHVPQLNISGYFYLNKIENYASGITACELIRL